MVSLIIFVEGNDGMVGGEGFPQEARPVENHHVDGARRAHVNQMSISRFDKFRGHSHGLVRGLVSIPIFMGTFFLTFWP